MHYSLFVLLVENYSKMLSMCVVSQLEQQQQALCKAAMNGNMQEADRLSDRLLASKKGLDCKDPDNVSTSFCAIRVKQCHCVLLPAHVIYFQFVFIFNIYGREWKLLVYILTILLLIS